MNGSGLPETMEAYGMQGTPTVLVFDRQGRLRRHYLGAVDDVRLGAEIMALCIEDKKATRDASMAIEMKLHAALVDPQQHEHAADGSCCGGHGHSHDHDHGHDHAHAHDHSHEHAPTAAAAAASTRTTTATRGTITPTAKAAAASTDFFCHPGACPGIDLSASAVVLRTGSRQQVPG